MWIAMWIVKNDHRGVRFIKLYLHVIIVYWTCLITQQTCSQPCDIIFFYKIEMTISTVVLTQRERRYRPLKCRAWIHLCSGCFSSLYFLYLLLFRLITRKRHRLGIETRSTSDERKELMVILFLFNILAVHDSTFVTIPAHSFFLYFWTQNCS